MPRKNINYLAAVAGALIAALPPYAFAINGMYLTGYGTESALMGGADVAVARDAFAANNNPAGMTQQRGQAADLEVQIEHDLDVSHSDSFGADRKPRADHYSGLANAAYARRLEGTDYAAGVALVVQGGLGWTYRGLNTRFGTRDDAATLFAVLKLAPALAWKVNDQLSLGAALGVNYFAGTQELFPNTTSGPVPGLPLGFNGFRFKGAGGIGLSSKWGLQYRPREDVTLGLTYGTRTGIPMKGGNMRINFSNLGLGVVRYDNARLDGFRLPEELSLGISFRPAPAWLLSLQGKRYFWSDALNQMQLVATSPRTPGAPAAVSIPSVAGFVDQDVLALGLAYDYDADTVLMAGLNCGRQPIPSENVNAVFAPIPSRHLMFGVKRNVDKEWQVSSGLEIYLPQTATYSNPVFGSGASEHNNALVLHLGLGRRW